MPSHRLPAQLQFLTLQAAQEHHSSMAVAASESAAGLFLVAAERHWHGRHCRLVSCIVSALTPPSSCHLLPSPCIATTKPAVEQEHRVTETSSHQRQSSVPSTGILLVPHLREALSPPPCIHSPAYPTLACVTPSEMLLYWILVSLVVFAVVALLGLALYFSQKLKPPPKEFTGPLNGTVKRMFR